jgi:S-adenosylmethionine:tRNA ribosyltransferase-isomerase
VTAVLPAPAARFALPHGAEAPAPPERRGTPRDDVRLLVSRPSGVEHRRFRDLPDLLEPGDLLVVNTSATLAAALDGRLPDGSARPVHVSAQLDDGSWAVELRRTDGRGPDLEGVSGLPVALPDGLVLRLREPYPHPDAQPSRLWRASTSRPVDLAAYLAAHGRPVSYGYLSGRYPLEDYQTVFAAEPGSAEMASAARPFTPELVVRLVVRGIAVAPVLLHAGVSNPELAEPPLAERFAVPPATAALVQHTRAHGSRVVAVGTTSTRALESAAAEDGTVRPARGWTDLVLGPDRPARAVTGLVSGLHAPEASHLLLLEAVAGPAAVRRAYEEAVRERYLWHEFGDSSLFLP